MISLFSLFFLYYFFISGCAISTIVVNTPGQATDVIDVSPKLPGSIIP